MEIFHADFGIISEIQRAKFGILLSYMFGGKIWGSGSDTIFRGKFCGQAHPPLTPQPPDMEVPPGNMGH